LIKKVYLSLHYLVISIITLTLILAVIASHPATIQYIGDKFLKESGLQYSKIEGSLFKGITLSDANYSDAIIIKTLQINYNISTLLKPTPSIKKIKVTGLSINPKNLAHQNDSNNSTFSIPAFEISELTLSKTEIILDNQTFTFDLTASGLSFDEQLNVKKLAILLSTPYGEAKIEGRIKSNHLLAKSFITPEKSISSKYLSFLEGLPKTYTLDLDASLEKVVISTKLDKVSLSAEQNLSLQNTALTLNYFVEEKYFSLDTSYSLSYREFEADVKQKALFTASGAYSSDLNATLTKQPIELPFKRLVAEFSGDTEYITAALKAGPLEFGLLSKEYQQFVLHAKSNKLSLSFITALPERLRKNILSLKADAILDISPFSLKGALASQGEFSKINGAFEIDTKSKLFQATLHPKPESEIWGSYPLEKFSPMNFVYYDSDETTLLNSDANMLNITLFKKAQEINGWGNMGSAYFDTQGSLADEEKKHITLLAKIPSVHTFLEELVAKTSTDTLFFDAEADINATLTLSPNISLNSRITMPWLVIKPDEKTSYLGENLYIDSRLDEKELTINEYKISILNNEIYSKRASTISLDDNSSINLKEFWIYDSLLLNGYYNPTEGQGNLHLKSNRFNYESKEGNVTLKTDIKANFESNGTQNIEGSITLLDGVLPYEPTSDYTLSDDIIIIQDIHPVTNVKRSINIQVNSLKPINYKTENIDIRVTPDITLLQEPDNPLKIFGIVTIEDGKVTAGDKEFEFDKSEIYFNGLKPINPNLNLNLHYHTIDYIDIEIFITNTLASPLIIFSSTPQMSQNDIMSYILFGEAASADFDSSGEGSNKLAVNSLLLATGLKQMFNETSGVNIDTLNIITNKEGTLGYEIGKRFNKQIRVVYRNDTISSVILQYSLSKSVRIDVDVRETGQGVIILYVKDF